MGGTCPGRLLLRPATEREKRIYLRTIDGPEEEAFWCSVLNDEQRFRGR